VLCPHWLADLQVAVGTVAGPSAAPRARLGVLHTVGLLVRFPEPTSTTALGLKLSSRRSLSSAAACQVCLPLAVRSSSVDGSCNRVLGDRSVRTLLNGCGTDTASTRQKPRHPWPGWHEIKVSPVRKIARKTVLLTDECGPLRRAVNYADGAAPATGDLCDRSKDAHTCIDCSMLHFHDSGSLAAYATGCFAASHAAAL
jgi:hypothetical protein